MTHEDMIEIIKAHKDGKTIQLLDNFGAWVDVANPEFNFGYTSYRIKPSTISKPCEIISANKHTKGDL